MEQKKNLAASVLGFLGNIGGLTSIALVIWNGGIIFQRIGDHERRIGGLETGGSSNFQRHERLDEERWQDSREQRKDISSRMGHQEENIGKLLELKSDVRDINTKLDAIKEQINGKDRK